MSLVPQKEEEKVGIKIRTIDANTGSDPIRKDGI